MTLLVLALAVCPVKALAASDVLIPGMDELTDALPEEAAPILSGVSPEELPKEGVWRALLQKVWEKVRSSAADICRTGGILLHRFPNGNGIQMILHIRPPFGIIGTSSW